AWPAVVVRSEVMAAFGRGETQLPSASDLGTVLPDGSVDLFGNNPPQKRRDAPTAYMPPPPGEDHDRILMRWFDTDLNAITRTNIKAAGNATTCFRASDQVARVFWRRLSNGHIHEFSLSPGENW